MPTPDPAVRELFRKQGFHSRRYKVAAPLHQSVDVEMRSEFPRKIRDTWGTHTQDLPERTQVVRTTQTCLRLLPANPQRAFALPHRSLTNAPNFWLVNGPQSPDEHDFVCR